MAALEKMVIDHLDLWTSAIKRKSTARRSLANNGELYGIKKLRELILDLAVRGLLIPQVSSDEPASELLKRIAAEKTKLVNEGKIKKEKLASPICDKQKSFSLPHGWTWTKLEMLMEMFNGRAFKQTEWATTGLPIIRIQNLNDKSAPFNFFDGELSDAHRVEAGNLLISWSGTPGTSFGAFIWDRETGALNQHINKCLIFGSEISKDYLKLAVNSCMDHLIENAQGGAGLKHVTKGTLNNLVLGLPPLSEQHRIVAKVDELTALCDQLEQQTETSLSSHQTLVETLLNALISAADNDQFYSAWKRIGTHFDTLFTTENSVDRLQEVILSIAVNGKLVEFPQSSKEGKLKDFLSFGPKNGFSPRESQSETGQAVLKLGATSYGALDLSQTKFFEDEIPSESHLWLRAGDILLQRGNSHIFVGSNVLIENDIDRVIYPDLMMKLRVTAETSPEYVSMWLSAPPARKYMWDKMTGTSGTMPKISKSTVEHIPIVVPPLDIQEKTIIEVKKLMALCGQLKICLNEAQTTKVHLADAMTAQALMG